MDGILNINKPAGMTSHDVVALVRRITKAKKVGHTGTLDPEATGVLPLCIGKATKSAQYICNTSKVYECLMKLGIRTDTQDATGKIVFEGPIANIKKADIEKIFLDFEGEQEQIPPMYSAVRYKGKRLYELARKGIHVERKPKKIIIYYLRFQSFIKDLVTFEVKTSPGTYVRTICDQAGELLGCGAHLDTLKRTKVGPFSIQSSLSLEEVEERQKKGTLQEVLYSVEEIISKCCIEVSERTAPRP